jgi:hypothetical protein
MIFTPHQILLCDQIKQNQIGEARGTHIGEENCVQGFSEEA